MLASSMVPQAVIRRINSLVAQFLRNSLESVCSPIEAGGLGVCSINLIREALYAKLIWLILSGS